MAAVADCDVMMAPVELEQSAEERERYTQRAQEKGEKGLGDTWMGDPGA